jgi:hypothetical protein
VPASGFVLLRYDARLRAAPRGDAPYAALSDPSPDLHVDPLHATQVAKVVARSGAYVGVATGPVTREESGCHRSIGREQVYRGFDIVVWVHEDDLHPVIVEPFEATFDVGGAELSPGLAAGPPPRRGPRYRTVLAGPMAITLEVPDFAVGLVYQPGPPRALSGTHHLPQRCDGAPCHVEPGWQARVDLHDGVALAVLERGDPHTDVELHTYCAVVRGATLTANIIQAPLGSGGGGSACGGYSRKRDFRVRTGAPVHFADGTPAGTVAEQGALVRGRQRVDGGERACFRVGPGGMGGCEAPNRHLTLCFAPEDLTPLSEG